MFMATVYCIGKMMEYEQVTGKLKSDVGDWE